MVFFSTIEEPLLQTFLSIDYLKVLIIITNMEQKQSICIFIYAYSIINI